MIPVPIENLSIRAGINLTANLGLSYNDDFCDVAGNLISLGASYEFSIITLNLDCVTNFGADGNDIYSGLRIEASVSLFLINTVSNIHYR